MRGQRRARSSAVAFRARSRRLSPPIVTSPPPAAMRFSNHAGLCGRPPYDATSTMAPSSSKYVSGDVRRLPVFLPTVVRSRTGMPAMRFPSRPPVAE